MRVSEVIFTVAVCLATLYDSTLSAGTLPKELCRIYPKPDAEQVSGQVTIQLRFKSRLQSSSDVCFYVSGNQHGLYAGDAKLSKDKRTLIFKPYLPYQPGETIYIKLTGKVDFDYQFDISPQPEEPFDFRPLLEERDGLHSSSGDNRAKPPGQIATINGVTVPSDFPEIRTHIYGETAPGRIFFASTWTSTKNYLIICENDGTPYFYRRYSSSYASQSGDFKVQPSGVLSAYFYGPYHYVIFDNRFCEIDTFKAGNGYITDTHELRLLPNGEALLIALDYRQHVNLSDSIPGAGTNVTVIGNHLQQVDSEGNVWFEWLSWDHFRIQDAIKEDLTASTIDYVHMNSIAVDYDSNLVISSKDLSEVTKINWETGEIIWRLGGVHNQFDFINDDLELSYQHHVRPVPGRPNQYTIFDNGKFRYPELSRAVEFKIDIVNMTAEKVWEFRYSPDRYTEQMGSVQRLPNGNSYIDWCSFQPLWACEVDSLGNMLFEIECVQTSSYRSKRFVWEGMADEPYLIAEPYNDRVTLIFNKFGDANVKHYRVYGDTLPEPTALLATCQNTFAHLMDLANNKTWYFRVTAVDSNDNESGYSNTESVDVEFIEPGQNHIKNGDFSSSARNWTLIKSNGAVARGKVMDGVYYLQIDNGGTVLWDLILRQQHLQLVQNKTYLFEFDAYADAARMIEPILEANDEPHYNYGEFGAVMLGTEMQHFEFQFKMEHVNDFDANVVFHCGESTVDVYLDNISLIEVVDTDVAEKESLPVKFRLDYNSPNPFNPFTWITFALPKEERATLKIYDLMGREVWTLVNGHKKAGTYRVTFDGSNLPSGIYIYKLETPSFSKTHKMILMK